MGFVTEQGLEEQGRRKLDLSTDRAACLSPFPQHPPPFKPQRPDFCPFHLTKSTLTKASGGPNYQTQWEVFGPQGTMETRLSLAPLSVGLFLQVFLLPLLAPHLPFLDVVLARILSLTLISINLATSIYMHSFHLHKPTLGS